MRGYVTIPPQRCCRLTISNVRIIVQVDESILGHTSGSYMQTTTTVSEAVFSTASRYPLASTSLKKPHFRLLGLWRLWCFCEPPALSSLNLLCLHCSMNSSSSSSWPLPDFSAESLPVVGGVACRDLELGWKNAPFAIFSKVFRREFFFARLNDCASAITPFGPVLASKKV